MWLKAGNRSPNVGNSTLPACPFPPSREQEAVGVVAPWMAHRVLEGGIGVVVISPIFPYAAAGRPKYWRLWRDGRSLVRPSCEASIGV